MASLQRERQHFDRRGAALAAGSDWRRGGCGSGSCATTDAGDAQISNPTMTSASRMRPSHERVGGTVAARPRGATATAAKLRRMRVAAIVLGAGSGARLRAERDAAPPKALVTLGGVSLLARSLAVLASVREIEWIQPVLPATALADVARGAGRAARRRACAGAGGGRRGAAGLRAGRPGRVARERHARGDPRRRAAAGAARRTSRA